MQKFTILALCMILVSSCTAPSDTNKPSNWMTGSTSYKQDIDSFSEKIKNSEEFNSCMKQHATMCVQSVGMEMAQKAKDANFCKELTGKDQQLSCEFAIAMMSAQEENNDKACDTLTDDYYAKQCKIQLYKQDATNKKDLSVCDKIDVILQTGSGTSNNGAEKDQCILQYVMNISNSKWADCEKILDETSLAMCRIFIKNRTKEESTVSGSTQQ